MIGAVEILFLVVLAFAAYGYISVRARRRSLQRLDAALGPAGVDRSVGDDIARHPAVHTRHELLHAFPRRYQWFAFATAAVVFAVLNPLFGFRWELSAAVGFLCGVCAWLGDEYVAEQRVALIETQLSEAIDMLVASLRVGAALLVAFESSLREARPPLRPYLQEIVGRFRLGDDPRVVVAQLPERVPLETFRLFALSMAVHWDVGGSVASTLATVGRTIRDRIELARRVRAQAVEAHLSVVVVMGIAYALAYLMWQASPERVEAFVSTDVGVNLVALVIALQGVGLIWMSRISRSSF